MPEVELHTRRLQVATYGYGMDAEASHVFCQLIAKIGPVLTHFSCTRLAFSSEVVLDPAALAALGTCSRLTNLRLTTPTWDFLDFAVLHRLTVLRVSLPSWRDLKALTVLPGLVMLGIDTTDTPVPQTAPSAVTLNLVSRLEWSHHGVGHPVDSIEHIARTMALPLLKTFDVVLRPDIWGEEHTRRLQGAVALLAVSFLASSPSLDTYGLSITESDAQDVFTLGMPASVRQLNLNWDLKGWYEPSVAIQDTITRVTLATHHWGTTEFLSRLCNPRQNSNIKFVRVDPDYTVPARQPRLSAAFSPWTWANLSAPPTWLWDPKAPAESHSELGTALRPFAAELRRRGITVVDTLDTPIDHINVEH
jgi:hypothetical protein